MLYGVKNPRGGDRYGDGIALDFSANVSPLGTPKCVTEAIERGLPELYRYPDPYCRALVQAIARYEGVPGEFILCGNGASELIYAYCEAVRPGRAMELAPTFSEYSLALQRSGCGVVRFALSQEEKFDLQERFLARLAREKIDALFLCNPNNPTSTAITRKDMRLILDVCKQHDIFVMVDETYVEFAPDINAITAVPLTREFTNLMVLRGVSKFFAAPGMRLGYGITGNMDFLAKMREKQTPWSLNSLGAFAGEIMLQDEDYIKETRNLILSERDRMIRELKDTDTYKIYPAYANFILLRILKNGLTSYDVFEACIRQGMMIRACSSFQCLDGEFVRFCIMMPEDNSRLVKVLKSL